MTDLESMERDMEGVQRHHGVSRLDITTNNMYSKVLLYRHRLFKPGLTALVIATWSYNLCYVVIKLCSFD